MASQADIAARVKVSITDGVAHVCLTRADKRNALDDAMFQAIAAAGERVKNDTSVRAVVLSGDGPSFCAGLDFGGFQAMGSGGAGNGSATAAGSMKDGRITHLAQVELRIDAARLGQAEVGGGQQRAVCNDNRALDLVLHFADIARP